MTTPQPDIPPARPAIRPQVPPRTDAAVEALAAALCDSITGTPRQAPSPERAVIRLGHLTATRYGFQTRTREYQTATFTLVRPPTGTAERRFRCPTCQAEFAVDLPSLAALPAIRLRYRGIGVALMMAGVLVPLGTWLLTRGAGCALLLGALLFASGIAPLSPMAQYRVKLRRTATPATPAQRASHRLLSARRR